MTRDEAVAAVSSVFEHAGAGCELRPDGLCVSFGELRRLVRSPLLDLVHSYLEDSASRRVLSTGNGFVAAERSERVVESIDVSDFGAMGLAGPLQFVGEDDKAPVARVGDASDEFVAMNLSSSSYIKRLLSRTRRVRAGANEPGDLQEFRYLRPLTIRLDNIPATSPEEHLKLAGPMVDACLFKLSSTNQLTLRVVERWPSEIPTTEPSRFVYDDGEWQEEFSFPKVRYNPDLVRFFFLASSSTVPELQYLSYYQVLEYFFVALSDEQLYERMGRRINDPKFRPVPAWFDRVIQDVNEHRRLTDETEMLKLVVARFVSHEDLLGFIDRYHAAMGEKWYFAKQPRFGTALSVNREANHTFGDTARIIKTVRNALVHSSDRHERAERHVPFSESSELVRREVPLVRFLAERVVVGSASASS